MSILFNGAFYYQTAVSTPLCEGAKTLSCKFYLTSLTGLQGFFNQVSTSVGFQLGIRNSMMTMWSFGGGIIVQYTPTLNQWIHVCYTYNPTGVISTLYENGVSKATTTTAVQTGAPTMAQVGGNQWNESPVTAYMEDLRIYDRVLSLNEINTITYSDGDDFILNGLVHWWPMNEGLEGTTLNTSLTEYFGATSTLVGTAYPVSQPHRMLKRPVR